MFFYLRNENCHLGYYGQLIMVTRSVLFWKPSYSRCQGFENIIHLVTIFIGRKYLNDNFHFASKKNTYRGRALFSAKNFRRYWPPLYCSSKKAGFFPKSKVKILNSKKMFSWPSFPELKDWNNSKFQRGWAHVKMAILKGK